MINLQKIYFDNLEILNSKGKEALIYQVNNTIYKIYRNKFPYIEEKVTRFKNIEIENVALLKDVLIDINPYGYIMDPMYGVVLNTNLDYQINSAIVAAKNLPQTIKEISSYHLTPSDINVDNILFNVEKQTFEFVDTYGYIFFDKFTVEKLYNHNLKRINDTILCGLLSQEWKKSVYNLLLKYNSNYLKYVENNQSSLYLYNILSILQEILDTNTISEMKQKIITQKRR